jgi:hypothetical protein
MAESKSQRAICLEFECLYDRYAREKLAQVYRILVPAGNDPIQTTAEELSHEKERSYLCQSFLGSAARTEHHR